MQEHGCEQYVGPPALKGTGAPGAGPARGFLRKGPSIFFRIASRPPTAPVGVANGRPLV
jgi:hypothetical protein